mgnify:CR=1 FL=1
MKYLLILLLAIYSFAASKYDYGNIDMHGGKKVPLVNKTSKFGNKNMGMSHFLNTKEKKKSDKSEKVKKHK